MLVLFHRVEIFLFLFLSLTLFSLWFTGSLLRLPPAPSSPPSQEKKTFFWNEGGSILIRILISEPLFFLPFLLILFLFVELRKKSWISSKRNAKKEKKKLELNFVTQSVMFLLSFFSPFPFSSRLFYLFLLLSFSFLFFLFCIVFVPLLLIHFTKDARINARCSDFIFMIFFVCKVLFIVGYWLGPPSSSSSSSS